jgi:serine/threonine protein kinase
MRHGVEAVDLLERMLALDPDKRIDAEGALDHNFFYVEPVPCDPDKISPYLVSSHEYTSKNRYGYPL